MQEGILISLPAGGSVVRPHSSKAQNGVAIVPAIIYPDRNSPIGVLACDLEQITFVNPSASPAEARFYLQVLGGGPYIMHWRGAIQSSDEPLGGLAFNETDVDSGLVDIEIWVDGVNGDDANSGLLPTDALRTHAELYRKYPQHWFGTAQVIIHTAGTGGFAAPTTPLSYNEQFLRACGEGSGNNYVYRAAPKCAFVPTTGPATAALDAVPLVVVDQANVPTAGGGRARLDFTVAAPGWTPNDFRARDAFLRITRGGVRLIDELPIAENGADYLIVDNELTALAIVDTDVVTIVRPSVQITGTSTFDLGATVILGDGSAIAQTSNLFAENRGATFDGYRFNLIYTRDVQGLWFNGCYFAGFARIDKGSTNYTNIKANGTFLHFSTCDNDPRPRGPSALDPTFPNVFNCGQWKGLTCGDEGQPAAMNVFRPIASYGGTHGVSVRGQSFFSCAGTKLLGSGNTQFGLRVHHGSQARIAGGLGSQIVGGTGNLQCDVGTAVVNFGTGAGQFQEAAGFNGNLHRVGGSTATVPLGGMSRISITG